MRPIAGCHALPPWLHKSNTESTNGVPPPQRPTGHNSSFVLFVVQKNTAATRHNQTSTSTTRYSSIRTRHIIHWSNCLRLRKDGRRRRCPSGNLACSPKKYFLAIHNIAQTHRRTALNSRKGANMKQRTRICGKPLRFTTSSPRDHKTG